jgi:hypothetical protein
VKRFRRAASSYSCGTFELRFVRKESYRDYQKRTHLCLPTLPPLPDPKPKSRARREREAKAYWDSLTVEQEAWARQDAIRTIRVAVGGDAITASPRC